jgi:hypothetical protein
MMDACATARDAGGSAGDVMRAMGDALLNGQEISVHMLPTFVQVSLSGALLESQCSSLLPRLLSGRFS